VTVPRRGPQARDLCSSFRDARSTKNLREHSDERERVSSKGACDRRARTQSERGRIPQDIFLKLRLVCARTKSERGSIPKDIF
jgi:hypothetical protein